MNRGLQVALFASVIVTILLFQLPFGDVVGRPLVWLSTLAHELGHGLTAVFVGGAFQRLEIYPNASGVAWTRTAGGWRDGAVAGGGLLGPAFGAAVCFLAGRTPHGARTALAVAAGVLAAVALLWVRNAFGFLFVVVLAVTLGLVARRLGPQGARFVVVFLGVQLSLSVFSRSEYLFTAVAETGAGPMPSDVARMSAALGGPYWFWGALCGLFSVAVLITGVSSAMQGREEE